MAVKIKQALRVTGYEHVSPFFITKYENFTSNGLAILTTMSMARQKISSNWKTNGYSPLYLLDIAELPSSNMVIIFNKQLKFLWQLNHQILNMISSNLLVKWFDEAVDADHLYDTLEKYDRNREKEKHPLSYNELRVCFTIFGGGLLLSFLVFVLETLKHTIKSNFFPTRA